MSDTIYRQAMLAEVDEWIEALTENCHSESVVDVKMIRKHLALLPSAQQWIPCSERLPDNDDHVLCTTITKKGIRNIVRGYYFHDDSYPGGGQWSAGMNSNVIAWMPLPEPYQGGQ